MFLDDFNCFLRDSENLQRFQEFIGENRVNPIRLRRRRKRINPLTDFSEHDFRLKYRFSKENMIKLIEMVRDDLELDSSLETRRNQVPVELQIMAALRFWGRSEHPDLTAIAHGVSNHTLTKICKRMANALASKASRYIRMPVTLAEKETVTNTFQALACMPHVIGAVAHSCVRFGGDIVEVDKPNGSDTREEHHMYIQIVSDASLKIRDLDCKAVAYKKQNYEKEMFTHSRIKERFEQNEFRGRILLGNDQLACANYLFTPVQCPITLEEQAFNRSHAVTYAPVMNVLNLWRRRFEIIGSEICVSNCTARNTIVALALLHNMAIEWKDPCLVTKSSRLSNGDYVVINSATTQKLKFIDTQARVEFIKNNF